MASYCSRYICDFATISAPLRELTKKNVHFQWSSECDQSFEQIKHAIENATEMPYFELKLHTEIVVEASSVGLGKIPAQHTGNPNAQRHIGAYASRSLSHTVHAYSQPEKQSLVVVWACEHFHVFLYEKHFTLVTDHQALLSIFRNPKAKMPPFLRKVGVVIARASLHYCA